MNDKFAQLEWRADVLQARADALTRPDADPCWDGYEQRGTKEKDGKTVPNCVESDAKADEAPIVPRKYWAAIGRNKAGPFNTQEEAIKGFVKQYPNKFKGKSYSWPDITTGLGQDGPYGDIRYTKPTSV